MGIIGTVLASAGAVCLILKVQPGKPLALASLSLASYVLGKALVWVQTAVNSSDICLGNMQSMTCKNILSPCAAVLSVLLLICAAVRALAFPVCSGGDLQAQLLPML